MNSPEPKPLLVEKKIQIYGYDIDLMGIVSNLVYPRWFEDLRTLFLDTYWPLEEMLSKRQSPAILTTHLEFKAPLTISDKPVGRLWLAEVGKVRWRVHVEIATDHRLHCRGYQEGIVFDLDKRKPVRLPGWLIEKHQGAQENLAK